MLKLTAEELSRALSGLTTTDKAELLKLLELRERIEAEAPEDPRSPMSDYLVEFGGAPHPVARPVSLPPGERPSIEAFVASFAPAMPAKPKPEPKATIADTPDIPLVVPRSRQPRLLRDVIAATEEEMRRSTQSADDVDRLHLYRGVGRLDLDAGGYTDE
jgi:hypothetical protein